jgi:C-terminal processing protease CtpA/Prc
MIFRTTLLAVAAVALLGAPGAAQAQRRDTVTSGTTIINRRPNAYIGLGTSYQRGKHLLVAAVAEGSPAASAGLAVGDTLISVDGHDTREPGPLFPGLAPGRRYTLIVERDGEELELFLTAAAPPHAH